MSDLTGQRFGHLTVLEPDISRKNRKYWKCQCDCGAIVSVYESHLKSSHTKSCGCYRKKRSSDLAADLKGRQFGRLKVLEYAGANQNGPLWRCQCSCGKVIVCGADNLRRGKTRSCGCFQEESRRKNMANAIHFVNGTCVEKIWADHRNGINSSNRSGYRGVYQRENGKWRAEISFQGKRHNLGTFESVEDAKMARITAENNLWGSFLKKYEDGR